MYPWASPPHKKESNVGRFSFEILLSSFPLDWCQNRLCSAGGCIRQHPRTVTIRVRTSMLSSLHQRPTQSWNSVFQCLPVPSFLLHLITLFCNTVLLTGCCSLTVSSRLQAVFLRRSITAVLDLKASSFLHTRILECVTTFALAFQRSDQTARCALHRTFRVAG